MRESEFVECRKFILTTGTVFEATQMEQTACNQALLLGPALVKQCSKLRASTTPSPMGMLAFSLHSDTVAERQDSWLVCVLVCLCKTREMVWCGRKRKNWENVLFTAGKNGEIKRTQCKDVD